PARGQCLDPRGPIPGGDQGHPERRRRCRGCEERAGGTQAAPAPAGPEGQHRDRLHPGQTGSRTEAMTDRRRELPSVDRLLREPAIAVLLDTAPRSAVVTAGREALESARANRAGPPADWAEAVRDRLGERTP